MLVRISKTEIINTANTYNYKLDYYGQLEVSGNYQSSTYSFEESMIIWNQFLEQIVYQHSNYLAVLHDPETCRSLSKVFNEQIFAEFNELEKTFRQIQAEIERENKEKERSEYLEEGIDIDDLEF
jgi:hypothetical protein